MRVIKAFSQIDDQGFWVRTVRLKYDPSSIEIPEEEGYVEADEPEGFYKPRWDGSQWIEGATPEEIDEFKRQEERERMNSTEVRLTNAEDALFQLMLKA